MAGSKPNAQLARIIRVTGGVVIVISLALMIAVSPLAVIGLFVGLTDLVVAKLIGDGKLGTIPGSSGAGDPPPRADEGVAPAGDGGFPADPPAPPDDPSYNPYARED